MAVINFIYEIIGTPLGYIMWACYQLVRNFGVSIILFTLIVKLVMLPLAVKQQKNTAKTAIFAPKVKEIQTKYKNNQQKQQEELAKLQQQGYNPMGGCAPLILTMVVLFGVIDVVYKPMTHMEHIEKAKIESIITEAHDVEIASLFLNPKYAADREILLKWYEDNKGEKVVEGTLSPITATLNENKELQGKITVSLADKEYVTEFVNFVISKGAATFTNSEVVKTISGDMKSAIATVDSRFGSYDTQGKFVVSGMLQKELFALSTYNNNPEAFNTSIVTAEISPQLITLNDNMNFLGIPLDEIPTLSWDIIVIIPILSLILSLAQTIITQKINEKTNPAMAQMNGSMKIMLYAMPVFSLWIAFTVPAGVGFYWSVSYGFGLIQTLVLNKFYHPEKLREEAEKEFKEKNKAAKIETTATVEEADSKDSLAYDENGNRLSQKEINRRRLAEARRLDAEKYGEEYIEVKDDDLK